MEARLRLTISSSLACCVQDAVWSACSHPLHGVAVEKGGGKKEGVVKVT